MYERLGRHWYHFSDHRPHFTQKEMEVLRGVLMGDGSLATSSVNPHIDIQMINEEYLEYLDDMFGCLSTGVRLEKTPRELAKSNKNEDFKEYDNPENYSPLYRLRTRNHPQLSVFESWYDSEKKQWDEGIELTPTVLKHYYACDGTLDERKHPNSSSIRISAVLEEKNRQKVAKIFNDVGLPEPNWVTYTCDSGRKVCSMDWKHDESIEIFDYMGEPVEGFEYKWLGEYQ